MKCQILQECFLQNFNMQKFQNKEHSNSRTFKGLEFFVKIQGLLKDPMNPVDWGVRVAGIVLEDRKKDMIR